MDHLGVYSPDFLRKQTPKENQPEKVKNIRAKLKFFF